MINEKIFKNFDRFLSFYNDNSFYQDDKNKFISEKILKFYDKLNYNFLIHENDLIVSICDVELKDDKNNIFYKIGCVKTELDEVLNNSSILKIEKCYFERNQFK